MSGQFNSWTDQGGASGPRTALVHLGLVGLVRYGAVSKGLAGG
jgi:hypothetical protein